jgi:hypothetical protein
MGFSINASTFKLAFLTTSLTLASLTQLAAPALSQPFYRPFYRPVPGRVFYVPSPYAVPRPVWPASRPGTLIADRNAESTCINAAEDEGLRVTDVIDRNDFEGGSEVVMRIRQRNRTYTVGCDYANNTGRVELYQLESEDLGDDGYDDYGNDRYNDERYSEDDVNDSEEAEWIARRAVEEQLGVDADSDVIRIDEARRNDRRWYVEGDVNGAPFAVRIRRDGSVEDFQLR